MDGMGYWINLSEKKVSFWLAREARQVGEVPGILTQYRGPREWVVPPGGWAQGFAGV